MTLESLSQVYLPAIEEDLRVVISQTLQPGLEGMHSMLSYHMGWEGEGAGPEARGKRIRPLLVLLATASCGGDWQRAIPAASAVELLHNFSLIHDDIQDQSSLRRGRPTLWKLWGIAQAINAGDAMFTLAHIALHRLEDSLSLPLVSRAAHIFQYACLSLTQGQYLDLAYEARNDLNERAYWPMVGGKTAALLATCLELGALTAEVNEATCGKYRRFGYLLGIAFQVQDDLLGIWGDAALTGKSNASDLLSRKKSLPVLYGLKKGGIFAQRWTEGPIQPHEVLEIAMQLEVEGGRDYVQKKAGDLTNQALQALDETQPQGEAGEALKTLTKQLLQRQL